MNKPTATAFKVEYYTGDYDDTLNTILIAATGVQGLDKTKARAKAISKETCGISYMVGCSEDGESLGHIAYSEGRQFAVAGCYAR